MAKGKDAGKDFYGKDIAEVIERASKELGASREELDIEVIETGSAGIFGLCKKKAHIRVKQRGGAAEAPADALEPQPASQEEVTPRAPRASRKKPEVKVEPQAEEQTTIAPAIVAPVEAAVVSPVEQTTDPAGGEDDETVLEGLPLEEEPPPESVPEESLAVIQADLTRLLALMGLPSEVRTVFEDSTVLCTITGAHEEHIVGPEGRTLDSLQYLLRKMVSSHLPDRIMLALDAGNFRERRGEELKAKALELAEQVKADGKTQAIPALNPSERRVVHMALQEDKGVRSRSVGEGLFKKVLIYKPGKGRRPAPRKRRGGQGGRPSEE